MPERPDRYQRRLTYIPAANAWGSPLGLFTFRVQDDGGTANGGVDIDPVARAFGFNIIPVNDAPQGMNNAKTIQEDTPFTFSTADFAFTDANDAPVMNNLFGVDITTLPTAGTLALSGSPLNAGAIVPAGNLSALTFTPDLDASG